MRIGVSGHMITQQSVEAYLNSRLEALRSVLDQSDGPDRFRISGAASFIARMLADNNQGVLDEKPKPLSKISVATRTRVRRHAPGTSWEAATSQTPEKSRQYYRVIHGVLTIMGPMTDDEIYDELVRRGKKVTQNTLRPRRKELTTEGWVKDSGTKRPSRMGRPSIVWEAIPESELTD